MADGRCRGRCSSGCISEQLASASHNSCTFSFATAGYTAFVALPSCTELERHRPWLTAQSARDATKHLQHQFFYKVDAGRKTKQKPLAGSTLGIKNRVQPDPRRVAELSLGVRRSQTRTQKMLAATYYQSPPPPAYGVNKPVQYYMESMPTSNLFYACARWVRICYVSSYFRSHRVVVKTCRDER